MAERFAGFGGISKDDTAISIGSDGEIVSESGKPSGETDSAGNEDRIQIVDPGANASTGTGASTGPRAKRKYTRRASGSKNKTISEAIVGLEEILVTLNHTIAQATKCPEFNIDADEAAAISKNIHNVAAEYDYQDLPQTTRKTIVWGNLVVMLGAFYGARIFDVAQRRRAEAGGRMTMPRVHDGVVDLDTMRARPTEP